MAAWTWSIALLCLAAGVVGTVVPWTMGNAMLAHYDGDTAHPDHPAAFVLAGMAGPFVGFASFTAWKLAPSRREARPVGQAVAASLGFLASLVALVVWGWAFMLLPAT